MDEDNSRRKQQGVVRKWLVVFGMGCPKKNDKAINLFSTQITISVSGGFAIQKNFK